MKNLFKFKIEEIVRFYVQGTYRDAMILCRGEYTDDGLRGRLAHGIQIKYYIRFLNNCGELEYDLVTEDCINKIKELK